MRADSNSETPKTERNGDGTGTEKKGRPRYLPVVLVVTLVVLAVAALTAMEDGRHFAALRRYLMYGSTSETDHLYAFPAGASNRYGLLGDDLLVVSENAIRLLRDDGTELYNLSVPTMSCPALSVGKNLASVCDVGGSVLYLLDSVGIRKTLYTEEGCHYYTARMSAGDDLAVIQEKNGYKAAALVYNSEGNLLFNFDSYSSYLSSGIVAEDGKTFVAVNLASQEGSFSSQLRFYDLTTAEERGGCAILDGLVLDLYADGDCVISLCDKRLVLSSMAGETLLNVPYGNLYLHDYSLTGEDFFALLLGRYQSGNICELTTYDTGGERIASLNLTEEVLDISAAGEYLAVLYSNSLIIYNKDLTEYACLDGTDYAGQVLAREDGTALVVAASTAWRFLP